MKRLHEVHEAVVSMDVGLRNKRHVLVFETDLGSLTVATDDIEDIAEKPWFRQFLNVPVQRRREDVIAEENFIPTPRPQQQRSVSPASAPMPAPERQQQQVQQQIRPQAKSFMLINPEQMSKEQWDTLSQQQQQEYAKYYNLQL